MIRTRSSLLAASLAITAVSGLAIGQCDPTYDGSLGTPGLGDGYADPILPWDDGTGEDLYVGGSFTIIGGTSADMLARFDPDTNAWSRLGTGLSRGSTNGFLADIASYDPGTGPLLVVAGRFTNAAGLPDTEAIAAWDGTAWQSMGLTVTPGHAYWDLLVADLGAGEHLYAAGGSGVPFAGIAQYDGKAWTPVGTGLGVAGVFSPFISSMVAFDDGSGPAVYAVGRFDSIDGANTQLVARWDGSAWSAVGTGLNRLNNALRYLNAAAVFDDGNGPALYVAGTQFGINGQGGSTNVARWDGTSWSKVGQVLGTGRITDLRGYDDGNGDKLYFSGTAFPGINNFGRLEGNTWVSVDGSLRDSSTPGQTTSGNWPSAFGLGAWRNNLLIGGTFITIGPVSARGLAELTPCALACAPDLTGSIDPNDPSFGVPDGILDANDFFFYLALFGAGDLAADLTGSIDPNNPSFGVPDGTLDANDFFFYLDLFAAGCP